MRIIGNDTKSRVRGILLHDTSERHLRRVGHGIRLIQHNELEPGHRVTLGCAHGEDLLRAGERLDLLAHDVDTTVVGGVELEHHLAHVGGAVDAACESEDGGCLAGTGRAVEEEMGEFVGFDEFVDGGEDVLVAGDVFERGGSVFLNPGGVSMDSIE